MDFYIRLFLYMGNGSVKQRNMGLLTAADLEPGLVLAKDVTDGRGRILLRAGNALSEKHLGILKKWGIHEVDVEGHGEEDAESISEDQLDPMLLEQAKEKVSDLFRHTDRKHPFIKDLFHQTTVRLARKMMVGAKDR